MQLTEAIKLGELNCTHTSDQIMNLSLGHFDDNQQDNSKNQT